MSLKIQYIYPMKQIILATLVVLTCWGLTSKAQTRIVEFESPKMKVFLPAAGLGNGTAVVACPGGGYSRLAKDHEGFYWAPFFNQLGAAYAVVEYTLPQGNGAVPQRDVHNAFKILTDSASVWGIDPAKIGIMGSSAGGHLAATVSTHPTETCHPAFQILFYPVISLETEITHRGTQAGFLGKNPSKKDMASWSAQNNVTASTPQAFIALSSDDNGVKPTNSILYYNSLIENNVPASMHIYPVGGHGWGYRSNFKYHREMLAELESWFRNHIINHAKEEKKK